MNDSKYANSILSIGKKSHAVILATWDLDLYLRSILKVKTDIFLIKNCRIFN